MAVRFAETHDVRVVPIIGLNHVQTIYDMLYMRGIDLGIVHSDVLEYMARTTGYPRVYQRISSLVELWTQKVAIIAGEQYRSLADLEGQKVNFRAPGKGSDVTGTILFDAVGIEVEPTRFDELEALEKVKSGEIAATVYVIEEPIEAFTSLSPADEVRLLGLPQSDALLAHYRAAELTQAEFPELIKGDGAVLSLAVPVILAGYNWPRSDNVRYEKARRFAAALVDGLDELKETHPERWGNVSLDRDVPNVQRLWMIDDVLAERAATVEREAEAEREQEAAAAAARTAELRAEQERLMAQLSERLQSGSAGAEELAELERLIEQFRQLLGEEQ